MYILILIALLVFPSTGFSGTVYFRANAETGNVSQWTEDWGGRVSGSGTTVSTAVKRSGAWSFRHEITTPKTQYETAKVSRWLINGSKGINKAYYFSAWYHIAEGFNDSKWKNVMQWKPYTPGGKVDGGVTFMIEPLKYGSTRELVVYHWACKQGHVPCVSFSQYAGNPGVYRQKTPIPVPNDKWFHIEAYYKPSAKNGQVIVWQDGKEIFNLSHSNLNTLHSTISNNTSLYWGVGNYISQESTGRHLMYTDDVIVTDYRVSTQLSPNGSPLSSPVGLKLISAP
jgi:hypothetical protein